MKRTLLKLVLPATLAVMASVPAFAQFRAVFGLGPVEVHMTNDRPPPMRRERRFTSPGPDYVWIGGFWDRDGERWAWRDGRWDMPPERGVRWIEPMSRREGPGWRHEPGHWSNREVHEGEGYRNWHNEHGRGHDNGRHEGDRHEGDRH